MSISAEQIARSLGHGKESRLGDGGWKTVCPAHNDKQASLTVSEKRGKILVRCHAGCTQSNVVEALQRLDLWPKSENRTSWTPIVPVPDNIDPPTEVSHPKLGKPVRKWNYYTLDGKLIGYIYRFEDSRGKTLLPMTYCKSDNGDTRWIWKSFPKPRPLYRLRELQKRPNDPVALFEGEKAADKAHELFGDKYVCMSWPGGSNAVKYTDMSPLSGRDVYFWPDADEPGFKAMEIAAEIAVVEKAKSVNMVILPEGLPKGWDVADDMPEGMPLDLKMMLDSARSFEPGGDKVISRFNKRYAFVLVGGKSVVLRETYDAREGKMELTYISPEAFSQYYANVEVQVGRASVQAGRYWLTHEERRSYENMVFAPNREIPGSYNLWRGYSVEPDPTGDWTIFKEHLLENGCQGDEKLFNWVFGWFAHIMQRPHKKAGTSLSFRGNQGTGKTIIGKIFGRLIRQHYTLVDDARYVLGNFNNHLASTILLHSDEGFWGGDPKYVGKLKSMVTSDVQRIEHKGKDSIEVENFMRLLITTNQDWVVPAGYEERRFAVLDMGRGREQDRAYFKNMLRQMDNGGYAGLLHDLLEFDLTSVDVGVIPKTVALQDQKEMSMSTVAKFWFTCLMEGEMLPGQGLGWNNEVMADRFYEIFTEHAQLWGVRYKPHPNEFFKEVRKLMPEGGLTRTRKSIGGKRAWFLSLPDLDKARGHFDELMSSKYEWPNEDDAVEAPVGSVSDEIPF